MLKTTEKEKLPISLAIICLNEKEHIEACIKSAPFVSEIVVVDSGSTDGTQEIARQLGAKVFEIPWMGFGQQKKRAAELATHEWILSLDADERVSAGLGEEIRKRFSELKSEQVGSLPRKSFYLGRWILHGGWYPDRQLRLFNRQMNQWDGAPIHEKILAKEVVLFDQAIEHYVFANVHEHVATNNRYSGLLAKKDFDGGRRFSLFRLLTKPPIKFFEAYFFKMGFLDGLAGFVIAVGASYSIFLRIIKTRELQDPPPSNKKSN